jgi:SNF2 family DNA or RNA helicase
MTERMIEHLSDVRARLCAELVVGSPIQRNAVPVDIGDIELMPHQIDVVQRVTARNPARAILADEPGLGKTIEAGLVMRKLIGEGRISRVLIAVPSSLMTQWVSELRRKLGIRAVMVQTPEEEKGSLLAEDICVISRDYFSRHYAEVLEAGWDMLVLDEAHHYARQTERGAVTLRHQAARQACKMVPNVLMLTATPLQLSLYDFWSLIQMVRPDLFKGYHSLRVFVDNILPSLRSLKDSEGSSKANQMRLHRLESMFPRFFNTPVKGVSLDQRIESMDLLKQVVIRHRKRDELPCVPRHVSTIAVDYTNEEEATYNQVIHGIAELKASLDSGYRNNGFYLSILRQLLASSSRAFLATIAKRKLHLSDMIDDSDESEDIGYSPSRMELIALGRFEEQVRRVTMDSKINHLLAFLTRMLAENPDAKVIIFTRFIATQQYLMRILKRQFGKEVLIFNGKMNLKMKDDVITDFKENGRILISTEAGGEGRNLQFCNTIINYDLQWNPVRLEQRIGRIDRIGQRKDVHVLNMATWNTVEQDMYERLSERMDEWERTLGYIDPILGELEKDVNSVDITCEEAKDDMERLLQHRINQSKKAASDYMGLFLSDQHSSTKVVENELFAMPTKDEIASVKNSLGLGAQSPDETLRLITSEEEGCFSFRISSIGHRKVFVVVKDKTDGSAILVMNEGCGWKSAAYSEVPKDDVEAMTLKDVSLMDLKTEADRACQYVAMMSGYTHTNLRPIVALEVGL